MRGLDLFITTFLLLISPAACSKSQNPPGRDAILLSNVKSLTLRANRMTSSRRVLAIPQLSCTGPSKKICNLYQPETMRCTNDGYDYDAEDVQWTCKASLPSEFKLGATDVVCEGYRDSDDKWVLKGSCGVEYRLLLTDQGEKRFGTTLKGSDGFFGKGSNTTAAGRIFRRALDVLGNLIFFGILVATAVLIFWPFLAFCLGLRRNRRGQDFRRGWGGSWGGGGGGGGGGGPGDGYPGPPPPYSSSGCSDGNGFGFSSRPFGQGWTPGFWTPGYWTPGFWTGALGGAAAGYQVGRAGNGRYYSSPRGASFGRNNGYDPGEGSSGTRSPSRFSATTSSTGFGSTRRR